MRGSNRTPPRPAWGLVVLMVVGIAVGMTVAAVPTGAQSSGDASFDSVTAEVTGQTLFGSAAEVTFEYQTDANAEVEFTVVGSGSTTQTSDGTLSTATVRTGGWFVGASYPVEVVATVGDQVCTATIAKGDGAVDVCETDVSDATFEQATAEVTKHSFWSGDVRKVRFTFETVPGTPVDLSVDGKTRSVTADEGQTTATVKVGGWFHGAEYPIEVSASTPAQTLTATHGTWRWRRQSPRGRDAASELRRRRDGRPDRY
ncbi:MAG: hypothetical protein U5K37_09065 [Natrialbaceae archaeon]|nr:hypothetical protein [Natrialbaceae archaeon]